MSREYNRRKFKYSDIEERARKTKNIFGWHCRRSVSGYESEHVRCLKDGKAVRFTWGL